MCVSVHGFVSVCVFRVTTHMPATICAHMDHVMPNAIPTWWCVYDAICLCVLCVKVYVCIHWPKIKEQISSDRCQNTNRQKSVDLKHFRGVQMWMCGMCRIQTTSSASLSSSQKHSHFCSPIRCVFECVLYNDNIFEIVISCILVLLKAQHLNWTNVMSTEHSQIHK